MTLAARSWFRAALLTPSRQGAPLKPGLLEWVLLIVVKMLGWATRLG
jgi:hypothetical protein